MTSTGPATPSPVLALLALLLHSFAAPAEAGAERTRSVAVLRSLVKQHAGAEPMVAAIHDLEAAEGPAAAPELVTLLAHEDRSIAAAAWSTIALCRGDATWAPSLEEIAKSEPQVARRPLVIAALGQARCDAALPVFRELLGRVDRVDVATRFQIARALGAIGRRSVGPELATLLRDDDASVRLAAAEAARALGVAGLESELLALLESSVWELQRAAVRALARTRPDASVERLIRLMRTESRHGEEIADALREITRLDLGADPDEWARQMQRLRGDGWTIPRHPDPVAWASWPRSNILFLVDVSARMNEPIAGEPRGIEGLPDKRRVTIARAELTKAIEVMSERTRFTIVTFAEDLRPWKRYLVPATASYRKSATSWLQIMQARARDPDLVPALLAAFADGPERHQADALRVPRLLEHGTELDAVFVITSGPGARELDAEAVRREVRERNRRSKTMLHVIAIDAGGTDLLKGLAEDSKGVFVECGK